MTKILQAQLLSRVENLEVIKHGRFTLSSGRKSNYYIDGRLAGLDGRAVALIGRIIASRLPKETRSVGGPAVGAVPLVVATLIAAGQQGALSGFYVRDVSKEHGRQRLLEGSPLTPAVIVDDTCTTGSSILKIAALLEERSIEVKRIIAVFDRGGGRRVIEKGYDYSAILTVDAAGKLAAA